jgi:hypothetical protein
MERSQRKARNRAKSFDYSGGALYQSYFSTLTFYLKSKHVLYPVYIKNATVYEFFSGHQAPRLMQPSNDQPLVLCDASAKVNVALTNEFITGI